jgi:hypothetical protein
LIGCTITFCTFCGPLYAILRSFTLDNNYKRLSSAKRAIKCYVEEVTTTPASSNGVTNPLPTHQILI